MKKYALLFLMALVAAVLAACSDDTKSSSSGDDAQEIIVRVNDDPDFLDPHKATASISFQMILNMFEGLEDYWRSKKLSNWW